MISVRVEVFPVAKDLAAWLEVGLISLYFSYSLNPWKYPITGHQQSSKRIYEMQFEEIYKGYIKFQVILNLKNSLLGKYSFNFSYNFIQSNFDSYQQKCESLIPNWLFEEKHKETIHIKIPFSQSNGHYALKFIKKLEDFTKKSSSLL